MGRIPSHFKITALPTLSLYRSPYSSRFSLWKTRSYRAKPYYKRPSGLLQQQAQKKRLRRNLFSEVSRLHRQIYIESPVHLEFSQIHTFRFEYISGFQAYRVFLFHFIHLQALSPCLTPPVFHPVPPRRNKSSGLQLRNRFSFPSNPLRPSIGLPDGPVSYLSLSIPFPGVFSVNIIFTLRFISHFSSLFPVFHRSYTSRPYSFPSTNTK